ncbi:DUF3828 domain-containing protein [Brevundimonas sp. AJA228-03]|uniref:DUF3828 domain-containing protein n=1 Tax=Brevundimonas sp. AJA228-03 TaxID=2752515 RepID=UPI001ADF2DC8|nr:DUF3828 domain-containing protein [Brevundimonas sp. AJA228-03]QTN18717.1 DUF3828 domain-containing protein [Brevundimonas sp. AJA228-03]
MRSLMMVSVAAIGLAACSQGEDAKAPDGDAAASASASSSQAGAASPTGPVSRDQIYAAAGEGPEVFVRTIYAQYVNGGPQGEQPAPGQDPIFSRIMNALIGADFRAANGDVPTLDYDPFCACQDQGDFAITALAVAQSAPNAAEANVAFTNLGEAKTLKLKLVREGINWKVDDIIDGETSVHDELMKVAEAAA